MQTKKASPVIIQAENFKSTRDGITVGELIDVLSQLDPDTEFMSEGSPAAILWSRAGGGFVSIDHVPGNDFMDAGSQVIVLWPPQTDEEG